MSVEGGSTGLAEEDKRVEPRQIRRLERLSRRKSTPALRISPPSRSDLRKLESRVSKKFVDPDTTGGKTLLEMVAQECVEHVLVRVSTVTPEILAHQRTGHS